MNTQMKCLIMKHENFGIVYITYQTSLELLKKLYALPFNGWVK